MVRHGMVTIGVAVQAETFTSGTRSTNTIESYSKGQTFSDNLSPQLTSSSKSAIFLPPSRNGQSQTLKITFQYNKENNLPEVVVNFNEEGQNQHLELKELSPYTNTRTPSVIGQEYPKKGSNAVQVYYFDRIDKPYSTQIFEVSPDGSEDTGTVKAIQYYKNEGDSIEESLVSIRKKSIVETDMNSIDGQYTAPPGIWAMGERKTKFGDNSKPAIVVEKPEDKTKDEERKEEKKSGKDSESVADEMLGKKDPSTNPKKDKSTKKNGGEARSRRKSTNNSTPNGSNNSSGSPAEGVGRSLSPVKDRSKIPVINSAVTGFMPCEYYRKKWLRDMGLPGESVNYGGNGYQAIQKTAGQKVVNKLTAQQKKLEEDAAAQRKRSEFILLEEMILDNPSMSPMISIRKKQTRLEPLQRTPPKCY